MLRRRQPPATRNGCLRRIVPWQRQPPRGCHRNRRPGGRPAVDGQHQHVPRAGCSRNAGLRLQGEPMKRSRADRHRHQGGFTLIELLIATALGVLVLSALTSIVLTTTQAAGTANSRIEASAQVRNFQLTAYDDFALARPPATLGCGTHDDPCTTQDLVLIGSRMPNTTTGTAAPYTVTYTWDDHETNLLRHVAGLSSRVVASNVTAFAWYVDSSGAHPTVVIDMTVTVKSFSTTYSESQTLRFYPRVTMP
ncbi:MAG: prepilin-type N-terminal cleavage/methylation domain-containing protein [Chloroflexi bacterium]|nr:MAG: prepilin-type N-terminal cleavage/methylation domain-containing protein [Chloroflexota bacterium]TME57758.1 MAG: prepilin-type N-terminal cleavage/methylation domain-containing protein [Chloroflexota bacterium]